MDSIIFSALEEICLHGQAGISLSSLWTKLDISSSFNSAVWRNLLSIPTLQFKARNADVVNPTDASIQLVEDAQKLDIKIVASEMLRDNCMGLSDAKDVISSQQHRALERLFIARTSGVTQNQLGKEFQIEGKNLFYIVKSLECLGLILRQKAVVKTKEPCNEGESNSNSSVTTNLMYLYRYAKHLGSQQRIEINKEDQILESHGNVKESAIGEDDVAGEHAKENVIVNDYLPAMKAICDKLEEANGKVLVISDIKRDLGYIGPSGHRAWRNIYRRLKDAGLVEDFRGIVNDKTVLCLRLVKELSGKNFDPKVHGGGNDIDKEQKLKFGRRPQDNDQLLELPVENQIYDLVDAEGSEGLPFIKVCERLGIDKKRNYSRLFNMFSRNGMHCQPENHKRTTLYRVWTSGNSNPELSNAFLSESKNVQVDNEISFSDAGNSDGPSGAALKFFERGASNPLGDFATPRKLNNMEIDKEVSCGSTGEGKTKSMVIYSDHLPELLNECSGDVPNTKLDLVSTEVEGHVTLTEIKGPLLEGSNSSPCQTSLGQVLTAVGAQREQRILERLQAQKFVLKAELYQWLVELEKDKGTKMDRKTLDRILKKLQDQGHCKCVQINMPVVTNCGRSRIIQVVLHPPDQSLHSELLSEIHERLRSFEMQVRGRGSSRLKNDDLVPVLDGVQRTEHPVNSEVKAAKSEAMRTNGFVLAKMVRVKLFHKFLWGYLSSSPCWDDVFSKQGHLQKNLCGTYVLFSLEVAIRAIPLELFLQVVGSTQKFDDMLERCKKGMCLSDLPIQEYKLLMDTQATGRLSLIIDILRRLKLLRLVTNECTGDEVKASHANLLYAMELKPYIEEPLSVVAASNFGSLDFRPRIRHDFILSNNEAVDDYWKTLEYCYAAADKKASLHAFPGSAVHEVFLYRSWASVRVMTADRRAELLKRIMTNDLNAKLSFSECKKIAKDLNLTLEQVLRVYYDKRQKRLNRFQDVVNTNKGYESARNKHSSIRKRKRSPQISSGEHTSTEAPTEKLVKKRSNCLPDTIDNFKEKEEENLCLDSSMEDILAESVTEPGQLEDDEDCYFRMNASPKMKPTRKRKFLWTDEADRQLVTLYVRHRAALGAKFHRVDWASVSGLPASPRTCARRITLLKKNTKLRKALMKLCNMLGERYLKLLEKNQNRPLDNNECRLLVRSLPLEGPSSNFSSRIEHSEVGGPEIEKWDDFDDKDIKKAFEDVLRCKDISKLEAFKRMESAPQEWSNTNMTPEEYEIVSPTTCDEDNASPDVVQRKGSTRSSRCRRFHQKLIKLWNEGIGVGRQVNESLAVSNAVELFKLVFLSTSKASALSNLLAETLRRYSEHDLFAAFSYLRDRKIMIGGMGGQPFELSQHFLHGVSRSPFPINTGKRAAKFSTWLHEREKDLMEGGINLREDLQCGDIFHLFALVSSGELSVSPCLPEEGVGEAEELRSLKRRAEDNELYDDDKAKKLKSLAEGELVSRREKGFPGIMVSVNRMTILTANAIELFKDDETCTHELVNDESLGQKISSSTNYDFMKEILEFGSIVPITGNSHESPWKAMGIYAEHLMSKPSDEGKDSHFDPEVFKAVSSAIQKAGDQGLSIGDVSVIVGAGERVHKIIIDVLEAFGQALKVNAYDSVRVVDALYRSKYFLTSVACFHQDVRLPSSLPVNSESKSDDGNVKLDNQCIGTANSPRGLSMDVGDVHKVTILNLPEDMIPSSETPTSSRTVFEGCFQGEAGLPEGNKESEISKSSSGELLVPIFPWINGDGTINRMVYNGLLRRVFGTVMQNPGILEEDIICRMDVLNPQSCKALLESMILDGYLTVRKMLQTIDSGPPALLGTLSRSSCRKSKLGCRKHFFANPTSTHLL